MFKEKCSSSAGKFSARSRQHNITCPMSLPSRVSRNVHAMFHADWFKIVGAREICISLSLSQRSPLICGVNHFTFVAVFLLHLFIIFGLDLPAYLNNHNPFNEFPSLVYWCTVIHHHRQQGPILFRRVRWDFMCVMCAQTRDLLF